MGFITLGIAYKGYNKYGRGGSRHGRTAPIPTDQKLGLIMAVRSSLPRTRAQAVT